ncbi:unnamed protein product [Rotaria magnacalcarata]|uniref:Uncharacterized protein n=1 Tax=Rotaria magnacalcarata TaxID=392030 RepID=A0A814KCR6_9BILA|nr:unnamed protein product [Rotaria magnacalcarata]CAF4530340.1 unnamed protein product [Rotaria magnacalcarata]CAF4589259.1 unnamed protein product [Rotaria magnacalcarata]CAF5179591.1 unnamed protein product [Rotaria magnacalcarata]
MGSSSDITAVDLAPSTPDTQTKYTASDMKDKTSATCNLCKDIVCHVNVCPSNYNRHLQRRNKAEYELWSQNASFKEKNDHKFKQVSLEDSLSSSPSSHTSKYGPSHPRQVELIKMIFQNLIVGLDLSLAISEKICIYTSYEDR